MAAIYYTLTDEAPALATYSLLPIIRAFASAAGIDVLSRDISLAARILANFPEFLQRDQQVTDALAELGELALRPDANIIKLPNISASVPQLKAAIEELQAQGFGIPDYPDEPFDEAQNVIRGKYAKVLGSAVNPVLREGNSDRRAPRAVKNYARSHPHSMGAWSANCNSSVATMASGDFRHNEKSRTVDRAAQCRIEFVGRDGRRKTLKEKIALTAGDVVDVSVMQVAKLLDFLKQQVADAKRQDVLFSLHMKATMMKVSDPIIFGHALRVYFAPVFEKFATDLDQVGADPNNGLASVLAAIEQLPDERQKAIHSEIHAVIAGGPALAMVDSERGITNLHLPNDVIVDASMPAMIRSSGKMWNASGKLQDTTAVIPDSSYAGIYQVVIADCREHGAFDPRTIGTVPNVGLMAQKAEEYGSHDKTFEIVEDGFVQVVMSDGNQLFEHAVSRGDIWRMCLVKDNPIRDWVKLAVDRARNHDDGRGAPAVFWLDADRPHDAEVIKKVKNYLLEHETQGLKIEIMSPVEAMRFTLTRFRSGQDTISVTGNVLRDYLTDLFPIIELGTSAKMLSIVPLMRGGGLFETGAGGSAPKHVQQFVEENYLRWDSLGEFMALVVSLEHFASHWQNPKAKILAQALDWAIEQVLANDRSPSRRIGGLDNRGSHFYLALYWAQALRDRRYATDPTAQSPSDIERELAELFKPLADELTACETAIVEELASIQGRPVEMCGYYFPDSELLERAMRPSRIFNKAIEKFSATASQPV